MANHQHSMGDFFTLYAAASDVGANTVGVLTTGLVVAGSTTASTAMNNEPQYFSLYFAMKV